MVSTPMFRRLLAQGKAVYFTSAYFVPNLGTILLTFGYCRRKYHFKFEYIYIVILQVSFLIRKTSLFINIIIKWD